MNDILARRSRLSETKLALLEKRLQGQEKDFSNAPLINPRAYNEAPHVSFAQQRVWFLDQMQPGNPIHTIPIALRLTGELNLIALERSFNEIVQRHESLRTAFALRDGELLQIISPSLILPLPVIDLQHFASEQQEVEVERLIGAEVNRPFDLAHGPLLRLTALKLGPAEYILILVMHHIVTDQWSFGVLLHEVQVLYTMFCADEPSPLAELPIQYADFAVWQRQWLQGEVLERELIYWKQQLVEPLPILKLPVDRQRSSAPTYHGSHQSLRLSSRLCEQLELLARDEHVTLFMVLLAAFNALLYGYTKQEDMLVGVPIANRNQPETVNLIGYFVNALVFRTDLSGDPTFRELLRRVRDVALDAYAHQDLPFEKLVEVLWAKRDVTYTPFFQVMFNFRNTPMPALELSGLRVQPIDVSMRIAKYDLTLYLWNEGETLVGSLVYRRELFTEDTIARIVNNFQTLLLDVATIPDSRLRSLSEGVARVEQEASHQRRNQIKQSNRKKLQMIKRNLINASE